jgi:hypothetical protein
MSKLTGKQRSGRYLINQSSKAGLPVVQGKGDHVKVYNRSRTKSVSIPDRELGVGLAATIVKTLVSFGVVFSVVIAAIYAIIGIN